MISWHYFVLCEEFVPAFPWNEFERKWLIENEKKCRICRDGTFQKIPVELLIKKEEIYQRFKVLNKTGR